MSSFGTAAWRPLPLRSEERANRSQRQAYRACRRACSQGASRPRAWVWSGHTRAPSTSPGQSSSSRNRGSRGPSVGDVRVDGFGECAAAVRQRLGDRSWGHVPGLSVRISGVKNLARVGRRAPQPVGNETESGWADPPADPSAVSFGNQTTVRGYEAGTPARARAVTRAYGQHAVDGRFAGTLGRWLRHLAPDRRHWPESSSAGPEADLGSNPKKPRPDRQSGQPKVSLCRGLRPMRV